MPWNAGQRPDSRAGYVSEASRVPPPLPNGGDPATNTLRTRSVQFTEVGGFQDVISGVVFHVEGISSWGFQHAGDIREGFYVGSCVTIADVLGVVASRQHDMVAGRIALAPPGESPS